MGTDPGYGVVESTTINVLTEYDAGEGVYYISSKGVLGGIRACV